MRVNELFSRVALWCGTQGASNINKLPGCWEGELIVPADPTRDIPADKIKVTFNGHNEEIDGVPGFNVRLASENYLAVAIVGPDGGMAGGWNEDQLLTVFKDATRDVAP